MPWGDDTTGNAERERGVRGGERMDGKKQVLIKSRGMSFIHKPLRVTT